MANLNQNLTCSRNKPPPARSSCYKLGRGRSDLPLAANMHAVQSKDSHVASPSDKPCSAGTANMQVATAKEVSECLTSWLSYLQMLNGLCGAGSRLSNCLGALVQDTTSPCHAIATQCQAIWEELVKATAMASSAVKTQVLTSLQEISTSTEGDLDARITHEHNQQMVCNSLMTFINLQQQFCMACCEFLGAMASSSCCQQAGDRHESDCSVGLLQQCFSHLYGRAAPHPAHCFPVSVLQGPQRRWSEAAAAEARAGAGEPADGTMRRWSMPWESSRLAEHHSAWHGRLNPTSKLTVPPSGSQDRSRSTTPDSVWHSSLASQEQLQEVIHFLSCRPGRTNSTQLYHASQHLPGVTLTSCPYDGPSPDWNDGAGCDEHSGCSGVRRGSSSPQTHRASWHASESQPHLWCDSDGTAHTGERNIDMYSSPMDVAILASRKSSSSTDSSSSHSLHSRSTTGSEGGAEVRAHLYSMWSGNDLAFMKLPESSEPSEVPLQAAEPTGNNSATPHTFYSSSK